jgi:hypothetical protein
MARGEMPQTAQVATSVSANARQNIADTKPMAVAFCSLAIIVSLVLGVGLVSHGVLRHIVQTLPLWVGVVFGFRGSRSAGWLALPSFIFWFVLMVFIWLFLLGIARIVTGHFTPIEIVMTIIVGAASAVGTAIFLRIRSSLSALGAATIFLVMASLQWICFRLSLLPSIAHR